MSPGAESVEYTPSLAYALVSIWRCSEHSGGSQLTVAPLISSSGGTNCRYKKKHQLMWMYLCRIYMYMYIATDKAINVYTKTRPQFKVSICRVNKSTLNACIYNYSGNSIS